MTSDTDGDRRNRTFRRFIAADTAAREARAARLAALQEALAAVLEHDREVLHPVQRGAMVNAATAVDQLRRIR